MCIICKQIPRRFDNNIILIFLFYFQGEVYQILSRFILSAAIGNFQFIYLIWLNDLFKSFEHSLKIQLRAVLSGRITLFNYCSSSLIFFIVVLSLVVLSIATEVFAIVVGLIQRSSAGIFLHWILIFLDHMVWCFNHLYILFVLLFYKTNMQSI